MKPIIFDTGPVVAWFCPRDEHHAWPEKPSRKYPLADLFVKQYSLKFVTWSQKTEFLAARSWNSLGAVASR